MPLRQILSVTAKHILSGHSHSYEDLNLDMIAITNYLNEIY